MTAIFGIVALDRAPVELEVVLRMGASLEYRPADASGQYLAHGVALGARALWVTPEAVRQGIPYRDKEAGLVCVADIRLDDRESVIDTLGVAREAPDEAFLCAAYQRWGLGFPRHLLGDFAFALYDLKEERLILGRDAYGLRSLYWARAGNSVLFASQAKPLFMSPRLERRLDRLRVAQYLARDFGDMERTFFEGIKRVPPGHILTVERGKVGLQRYFAFDPSRRLELKSSSEYAEQFKELFVAAVKARLRSSQRVGCMLSGGLDSSGVLGAMRTLEPNRIVPCFSARFRSLPAIDEGDWLALHEANGGIERHDFDADQVGPLDDFEQMYDELDEPFHAPNLFIYRHLARRARELGTLVVLDGLDGDTVVEHGVYFLAELLRKAKLRRFVRELTALHRRTGIGYRTLLDDWAAGPFKDRVRAQAVRFGLGGRPSFLSPAFAEDSGYEAYARAKAKAELLVPLEFRALHHQALTAPIVPFYLEVHDKTAAASGIDHRHPFFDRRLIEFCLALPPEQRLHNGWDRVVQRRAFAGLVPEAIRSRQSKSVWTQNFQVQLFARHGALIDSIINAPDTPLAAFCDLPRLRDARRRLAVGAEPERVHDLWCAVTLGLWLRRTAVAV